MPLRVPVPNDFFVCEPLSRNEIDDFRRIGHIAAQDLVNYTQLVGGPIEWTLHTSKERVNMFISKNENVPMFCGQTEIEATLDEIRSIFLTTTTSGVRDMISEFFPDILDNIRLYDITYPTEMNPHHYVSINWLLIDTPLKGFIVKHRDFCYLEHQQNVLIDGKQAWIRAFRYVEIGACPELEHEYGIIRGHHLHCGFIYMETDRPGYLQVTELHHNRPNGKLGTSVGDFLVTKTAEVQVGSMRMLQRNVRAYQLSQLSYLSDHAVVPKHTRHKCFVCLRKLGAFQRKTNCRRCGEVVCIKPCSAVWQLNLAGIRVQIRICNICSVIRPADSESSQQSSRIEVKGKSSVTEISIDDFSCYTESLAQQTSKPIMLSTDSTHIHSPKSFATTNSTSQASLKKTTTIPKPFGAYLVPSVVQKHS